MRGYGRGYLSILVIVFASELCSAQPLGENGVKRLIWSPLPPAVQKVLDAKLNQERVAKQIDAVIDPFPLPVCLGLCGAINRDGTVAVEPKYDWVDRFYEERAVVRVRDRYDHLYGYVDDSGRVISKPQFSVAGRFFRGLAQIDVDGNAGVIDREGKTVLWPQFGFVVPFTNDLFWVTEEREIGEGNNSRKKFLFDAPRFSVNGVSDIDIMPKGKWGLVDRSGEWIRRPEFLAVRHFEYDHPKSMWVKTEAGWGLMRTDLSWLVEPRFQEVGQSDDGLAPFKLDRHWGFIDSAGKVVIEPQFDYVQHFRGPYAPARSNKLYGFIDRKGTWVITPTYDMVYPGGILVPKSWWKIKLARKFGALDDALKVVVVPQFDDTVALCTDGRIFGYINKKAQLFSRDGAPIEDDDFCESMVSTRRN
jgi:hypothetical protein